MADELRALRDAMDANAAKQEERTFVNFLAVADTYIVMFSPGRPIRPSPEFEGC
jgi:hypothetical protein